MRNQPRRMDAPLPAIGRPFLIRMSLTSRIRCYLSISGTISRGRNSDTSGQMISAASTSSIGISMITVSLSA